MSERGQRAGRLALAVELTDAQQKEHGHHRGDDQDEQQHGEAADERGHGHADVVAIAVAEVLDDDRLVLVGVESEGDVSGSDHLDDPRGGHVRHLGGSTPAALLGGVQVDHARLAEVEAPLGLGGLVFRSDFSVAVYRRVGGASVDRDALRDGARDARIHSDRLHIGGGVREIARKTGSAGVALGLGALVAAHLDHALEVHVHRVREFECLDNKLIKIIKHARSHYEEFESSTWK